MMNDTTLFLKIAEITSQRRKRLEDESVILAEAEKIVSIVKDLDNDEALAIVQAAASLTMNLGGQGVGRLTAMVQHVYDHLAQYSKSPSPKPRAAGKGSRGTSKRSGETATAAST